MVNGYLRKPRLIVKDLKGTHVVLHVNDDGTHKDQTMIKRVMNDSIHCSGENIHQIIRRNPAMNPKNLETEISEMQTSLDRVMGGSRESGNQQVNVEMPNYNHFASPYQHTGRINEVSKEDV